VHPEKGKFGKTRPVGTVVFIESLDTSSLVKREGLFKRSMTAWTNDAVEPAGKARTKGANLSATHAIPSLNAVLVLVGRIGENITTLRLSLQNWYLKSKQHFPYKRILVFLCNAFYDPFHALLSAGNVV